MKDGARGGADTLEGGDGDDWLYGDGREQATAGAGGADKLYGGDGPDHLIGGSGNDLLAGGAGADRKRVVEGKSVSGRVDLGGRRVSKKNTNDNEGSRHNRTIAINYLK